MSLHNTINVLSNINAVLGSTMGYVDAKQNGVPTGYALADFGNNLMSGAVRNYMARSIYDNTGSYLGYTINSAAGYGNPCANYQATTGLFGAAMLTSPWMTSSIYGCGPFGNWGCGGSLFGGGLFGGCGMGSMFSPFGFYC